MRDEYLFISDCHLDASRVEVAAALIDFIRQRARNARCLYILGDLFEVWLGDDDPVAEHDPLIEALTQLGKSTELYFIAGNRDFLLGQVFADRLGMRILAEPELLQLGNTRVALMHGDTLCTDDRDYQAFRAMVREPAWQAEFLARPLQERRQIAAGLRSDSVDAMKQKSEAIMDVNPQAVHDCFADLGVDTIVHGHTHRPATHHYPDLGTRFVLGDWNPGPSFLSWQPESGFTLVDPRI